MKLLNTLPSNTTQEEKNNWKAKITNSKSVLDLLLTVINKQIDSIDKLTDEPGKCRPEELYGLCETRAQLKKFRGYLILNEDN